MNEIILSTNSLEFIIGLFTGIANGFLIGYFVYLHKGDGTNE